MLNSPEKTKKLSILFNGKNALLEVDLNNLDKAMQEAETKEEYKFTFEEVDKIIKYNSCQCWNLEEMFKYLKQLGGGAKPKVDVGDVLALGKLSAIWIKFSFMNHSCDENTNRFSIGDIIFVKAKRDIAKGDEITTLYIPFDMPYLEKQRRLSWYEF